MNRLLSFEDFGIWRSLCESSILFPWKLCLNSNWHWILLIFLNKKTSFFQFQPQTLNCTKEKNLHQSYFFVCVCCTKKNCNPILSIKFQLTRKPINSFPFISFLFFLFLFIIYQSSFARFFSDFLCSRRGRPSY